MRSSGTRGGRGLEPLALLWRQLLLAALAAGLALSALVMPLGAGLGLGLPLVLAMLACAWTLAAAGAGEARGHPAMVIAAAIAGGLCLGAWAGQERVATADSGKLRLAAGERVESIATVTSPERTAGDGRWVELDLPGGRAFAKLPPAAAAAAPLVPGERVRLEGSAAEPPPWRADSLRRSSAGFIEVDSIERTGGQRGGPAGLLDRARVRAERAISAGLGSKERSLALGFVLGQDGAIDPQTREDYRRSGLAHLLAVSGQNVILLAVLVGLLLAIAGAGPVARTWLIIGAIAAYVPIAGGGASILRAGVMGIAGLLAGLAGRASDRVQIVLVALVFTLAINPRIWGDVGWQLSFAAVIGIGAWAHPVSGLLRPRLERSAGTRAGAALADGIAVTGAATLATAPLMAHHFETVSLAAIPANLAALPAVAPVMWLGMLAGLLGQFPFIPTEPIGLIQGQLIAYISGVAALFAELPRAEIPVDLEETWSLLAVYAALFAGVGSMLAALRRRALTGPAGGRAAWPAFAVLALAGAWVLGAGVGGDPDHGRPERGALRVTALDIGQGDAILVQAGGADLLVDTGPPGAGLVDELARFGVERLSAVAITHHQLDHSGALRELLAAIPVGSVVAARPEPELAAISAAAGIGLEEAGTGDRIRLGPIRADVLWPDSTTPGEAHAADPNAESLWLALGWRGRRVLLTGDGEFEAIGVQPGRVDVLKLPHHGSADAGLDGALSRMRPVVALVSSGAGNRFGHPADVTIASLGEAGVCVARTDLSGSSWAEIDGSGEISIGPAAALPASPGCERSGG